MTYRFYAMMVIFFSLIAGVSQAEMSIRVDPSVTANSSRIKKIVGEVLVKQHIDTSNSSLYSYATVTFKNNLDHSYLLISLHSRTFFIKKLIKVNVDKNYNIISIEPYLDQSNKNLHALAQCPNPNIKFLIANPSTGTQTDLKSADYTVNKIYSEAVTKYGKDLVVKLVGADDSVQNFENYLSCPNLEGIFSFATHDEQGQSFFLYDGTFNYQFFTDQPALNYTKTIISFDTCYAFANTVPGLCQAVSKLSPKEYTGGVTPLIMYGSPETYACFWTQVLSNNEQPTKALLDTCARENDPFVKNSQAPLYIIGPKYEEYETSFDYFNVNTNLTSYQVMRDNQYIRLSLAPNESITKVTLTDKNVTFDCTGAQALFNNPGLKTSEFMLSYDGKTCRIMQFKTSDYPTLFPQGYAVYGISPYDQCGNG